MVRSDDKHTETSKSTHFTYLLMGIHFCHTNMIKNEYPLVDRFKVGESRSRAQD